MIVELTSEELELIRRLVERALKGTSDEMRVEDQDVHFLREKLASAERKELSNTLAK